MLIDDIILENDKRGISDLRSLLDDDFCLQAADQILAKNGPIVITTGFYILNAQAPETDGPPGALAIGNALEKLGYDVHFVTDHQTVMLLRDICPRNTNIIEFPITSYEKSILFCKNLISDLSPTLLISIERCAADSEGIYRNMRDLDISGHTAKIDLLFKMHNRTIGIGDGGNEIGMGKKTPVKAKHNHSQEASLSDENLTQHQKQTGPQRRCIHAKSNHELGQGSIRKW